MLAGELHKPERQLPDVQQAAGGGLHLGHTISPRHSHRCTQRVLNDLQRTRLSCPPSPVSTLDRRHTRRLKKNRQLDDRRGGGKGREKEPNHTTARKPGPLLIIQYSLSTHVNFILNILFSYTVEYRCQNKSNQ
jgi:hypothetical protein